MVCQKIMWYYNYFYFYPYENISLWGLCEPISFPSSIGTHLDIKADSLNSLKSIICKQGTKYPWIHFKLNSSPNSNRIMKMVKKNYNTPLTHMAKVILL